MQTEQYTLKHLIICGGLKISVLLLYIFTFMLEFRENPQIFLINTKCILIFVKSIYGLTFELQTRELNKVSEH